jgi:hypothetical protein
VIVVAAVLIWRPWHREGVYQRHATSYGVKRALEGNQEPETLEALKALGREAAMPLLKAMKEADSISRSLGLHYNKLPQVFQKFIAIPLMGTTRQ